MNKFNELLAKLQALEIIQTEGDWAENLPQEIWEEHFINNFKELDRNLKPDTRRHYEISTSVLSIYGGLLGITYITNLFSEISSYDDCYVTIEFEQMKEIQTVTYVAV